MRSLDTIETLETFVVLARLGSVGKPLNSSIFQKLRFPVVFPHLKNPSESFL